MLVCLENRMRQRKIKKLLHRLFYSCKIHRIWVGRLFTLRFFPFGSKVLLQKKAWLLLRSYCRSFGKSYDLFYVSFHQMVEIKTNTTITKDFFFFRTIGFIGFIFVNIPNKILIIMRVEDLERRWPACSLSKAGCLLSETGQTGKSRCLARQKVRQMMCLEFARVWGGVWSTVSMKH